MDNNKEQSIEREMINACTMGKLEIVNKYIECNYFILINYILYCKIIIFLI